MIPQLEKIKRLLHFDWDPIGVAGDPDALDEYDGYAFRAFVMLNEGADAAAIADYLARVATEWMDMPVPANTARIAARIMAIHLGRAGP